jgi:two-component system sensor histidine kinase KdpD
MSPATPSSSDLLLVLAHEVRTPLCAILGLADLLRDPPAPLPAAEQNELLDDIVAAALRLNRLLDDCLAAVPRGGLAIAPRAVAIEDLIARARIESGAPERIHVAITTPSTRVAADPDRIVQVLLNLFANALRASPERAPVLVTVQAAPPGLEVRVVDRGPGIDADVLLFTAGSRGRHASADGFGLGLSLCRRWIEEHGGTLRHLAGDGGATFVFTLPTAP